MDILPPPSTTAWLRRQTMGRHLTRVDELHWNFLPTFTTTRSSYVQWKNQTIAMLRMLFSPPGIAMPKGLCFTAVFFCLTPNFWGHWTDLNQSWTHTHLWQLFEKFGTNCPRHLPPPPWAGGQKRFMGPTLNFDRLYLCNGNMMSTIGKKLVNLQGLPYKSPNLVKFGPETTENGLWVFLHTP